MTHPEHRGQGYLHKLGERCLADMRACGALGYTFPNHLSEKSFRRTGWTELCRVPVRSMSIAAADSEPTSLEEIPGNFDIRATQIWDDAPFRVSVHRDQQYLSWRYQKPGSKYFRFISNDSKSLLILKLYGSGESRALHICDLIVSQEDTEKHVERLLIYALSFGLRNGATRLTAWLHESHAYAGTFDQLGLKLDSDTFESYIFVDAPEEHQEIFKITNWYLSHTDNDIY